MHVTQTNGNALELGDWRRQEGYPLLIARSTTKVLLEDFSCGTSPKELGETEVKSRKNLYFQQNLFEVIRILHPQCSSK